jgi:cell division protein ZapA (FtsZ GTPase activity inhibitor)
MNTALIIAAINAAIELLAFIDKARQALSQSGEMTKEQEEALDAKIAKLKDSPWWREED